jgi:EpsI family protein
MERSINRYRLCAVNGVLLFALAGTHWGRSIDAATLQQKDLFQQANIQFRDWKPADQKLTAAEQELLQPDAVLIRRFQGQNGTGAELAVVAGHRKQSVHTPGFCMAGGGWELMSQRECSLALPDGAVPATRAIMMRNGAQLLVTYFFTDGRYSTPNLMKFQGVQLVRRLQARVPLGALVRIIVPVGKHPDEAEKLANEFAQSTVPPVLQSLREAKLQP